MKNRFKRFLSVTTAAVTGTLIACIFWYGIYCLTGQRQLWHSWIPYAVLPEILSIGVLAGGITELVLPSIDVEQSRQATYGKIAIGSGQFTGQGWTNGHSHGSRCQWILHGLP